MTDGAGDSWVNLSLEETGSAPTNPPAPWSEEACLMGVEGEAGMKNIIQNIQERNNTMTIFNTTRTIAFAVATATAIYNPTKGSFYQRTGDSASIGTAQYYKEEPPTLHYRSDRSRSNKPPKTGDL